MYFGDHLFSDLRGPAKAGWRTAAIIHELEVCLFLYGYTYDCSVCSRTLFLFKKVLYGFLFSLVCLIADTRNNALELISFTCYTSGLKR